MLIVPLEQAKPGMKLAMSVTHPQHTDQDLLRSGFVLQQAVIDRMRSLGISCIFVDYPGLEELDKYLAPNLSPERQKLLGQLKTTLTAFQKSATPVVNFASYVDSTKDFISTLLLNGRNPVYLDQLSTTQGEGGVSHAMAVAQLALVIGIKLENYLIQQRPRLAAAQARDVVNLGIAGMMHDIGKTRLPEHLRSANGMAPPEKEADRKEWENHARLGYEMIKNGVETTAAAAVLHHHQHFDGTGFPARDLTGNEATTPDGERIHIFSRILLAADMYDRLTINKQNKRRGNLEILHLMRTQHNAWLDPEIINVLPKVIPPFPPGSKVTLSDGRRAIVTGIDPDDPFRPTVKALEADDWTMINVPISIKTSGMAITHAGDVAVGDMIPASANKGSAAKAAA